MGDEGNVISGNGTTESRSPQSDDNVVAGDKIGTDATERPHWATPGWSGNLSSSGNTIGGTVAGAADVISGNRDRASALTPSDNVVEGDQIGTDATGTIALGNGAV